MLSILESINWSDTQYPDAPKWIQDLVSEDEDDRIEIWWTFDHFGLNGLSSFSPVFVGVLVELVHDETIQHKENLLSLLSEITYYAEYCVEAKFNDNNTQLALEVIQIIIKGKADYLKIIRLNQNGWQSALRILTRIADYVYDILTELIDIFEHSQEIDRKVVFYQTISYFIKATADNQQGYIRYLLKNLNSETHVTVKHAIALALLHLQGKDISENVITLLKDFFRNNMMITYLENILLLPTELSVNIIINSFPSPIIHRLDIFNRIAILLSIVFDNGIINKYALGGYSSLDSVYFSHAQKIRNNKSIEHVTTLTKIQKEALSALVQQKELWGIKTNLYEIFGLPSTLEEIEKLVLSQI